MYLKEELFGLLRTDESIFDFIQETALDGMWYWDLENPENEWMNPKFWTVLGYNPDEMPHKSSAWQSIINQDDFKLAQENFTKHCENPNHPYDQIVRYTHKNGSTVWIRCRGLAIRNTAGKPIRMLGAHQDISDLKKSELELLRANDKIKVYEEKYRTFFDNSPLSYQSLDENGCFIEINPMWSKKLGYERDEVIGKWYGDFLHPDYVEHFRMNFPAFKKRGYISDVQFRLRKKDNTFIYVSFEGCIGYTPDGKFRQTYCVFKDITQQKKLENELIKAKEIAEESEKKFRTYVENANDIIYQVTPEGVFTYVSPNWSEFLGYQLDEVIGEHPDKFVHPDDLNLCMNFLHHVLTTGKKQSGVEYRVKHKNGTWRWHDSNGAPLIDKNGHIISYLGVARDITDRKLKEKERLELYQRYHTILKNFPNGAVFLFDSNMKYIHVEGKVIEAVGLQPETMIGKTVKDLFPPEVADIAYPNQMLLFEGKSCYYEVQFANRIFANWGEPVINHKSEIEEGIIFAVDITDLKNYEQEIIRQNDEYEALNEELRQTNENLFLAKERAEASETKFKAAFFTSPDSVNINKFNGEYVEINEGFTRLTGFTKEDVIGRLSSEIDIWAIPDDRKKLAEGLKKDGIVENLESLFRAKDGRLIPALMSAKVFYLNQEPHILSVTRDITEHKKSIAALQQIEWMLTEKKARNQNALPEYGDLSELNANGTILSSVGKEQLVKIASEYLDLLETSSAIYEKNGDYALGLFSSSWCQMMDSASRKLCNTNSNEEALKSGKWHCHESCWRDASLAAIETGKPADVKCKGGLRLYAVPIEVKGEAIGAINFGYGNPPTADDELQDLAALYDVPIEELRKKRQEYQIRPQFIIDYAKRRIQVSAQYLGNLIERRHADLLIQEKSEEIAAQNEELNQANLQLFAAKQKAEESEQRYALAIDASEQGIWDWNVETGEIFFSEQWKKQIGYEDHELKNDFGTWVAQLHPDEKESMISAVQIYLNNPGKHLYLEFRFRHKDGTYRWIHNKASSILNKEGKVIRMFGAHSDITERKKFEQLLQEKSEEIATQNEELNQTNLELIEAKDQAEKSQKKFKAIADTSPLAIYISKGVRQVAEYINPTFHNLFGYEYKEVSEVALWWPLAYPDVEYRKLVSKEWNRKVEAAIQNKSDIEPMETVVTCKDGTQKNILWGFVSTGDENWAFGMDLTAIRKTEQELITAKEIAIASEQHFKSLIENAPDGVVVLDDKGRFKYGSPNAARHFGYTKDEIFGHSGNEFTHPDDLPIVLKAIETILTNPLQKPKVSYRFKRKNGEYRWIETTFTNLLSDKAINGIILNFSDITERKQAEQTLINSQALFTAFMANNPAASWITDQNGLITYASPGYSKMFPTGDPTGRSVFSLYPEPIAREYVANNQRVLATNSVQEVTESGLRADGSAGSFLVYKFPVPSVEGNRQIGGTAIDITDRRAAEQLLQEKSDEIAAQNEELNQANLELIAAKEKSENSEERFNLAMKASNDGLFDWNLETNEIYYSPGWKKMLGYEEHELPNDFSVWEKTTDPDDVKKSWELQQKLINKEIDRFVVEFKMKHKKGHWVDILSRAEAFFNESGKAVRMVGTHTDISERKQAERERKEKEELEKKILLSEESLKFKQNFLANMSHEIRTPLTGILGMAEILSTTKLDTEQTDYLNTILISGENLREIINNVLDFSKIEAGKMQIKKKVFPLHNLYDTAESLFKSTCKKPITFEYTHDPRLPAYIKSDENRIKQVINNIISNAVKFTNKGEIHLFSELLHYEPGTRNPMIKISVSDTGVGIPEYLHEKLFRPFSQIDNRDIRQFEGTGLGLSICKNLVMMLGGEIGVQSSPKTGSTFWFTFTAEETMPCSDLRAKANENTLSGKSNVNIRILLAEDKLVNQKVIKLQLQSLGHEVTIVDNGKKAIKTFDPAKFDLILMDIQMPVMDGITAAQALKRKYDRLPPIIGLSANAFEGDREKYLEQGMDEYLTKPFVVADFVRLMDDLFGLKDES
jgi:PAS domain S-box-containing protein